MVPLTVHNTVPNYGEHPVHDDNTKTLLNNQICHGHERTTRRNQKIKRAWLYQTTEGSTKLSWLCSVETYTKSVKMQNTQTIPCDKQLHACSSNKPHCSTHRTLRFTSEQPTQDCWCVWIVGFACSMPGMCNQQHIPRDHSTKTKRTLHAWLAFLATSTGCLLVQTRPLKEAENGKVCIQSMCGVTLVPLPRNRYHSFVEQTLTELFLKFIKRDKRK